MDNIIIIINAIKGWLELGWITAIKSWVGLDQCSQGLFWLFQDIISEPLDVSHLVVIREI